MFKVFVGFMVVICLVIFSPVSAQACIDDEYCHHHLVFVESVFYNPEEVTPEFYEHVRLLLKNLIRHIGSTTEESEPVIFTEWLTDSEPTDRERSLIENFIINVLKNQTYQIHPYGERFVMGSLSLTRTSDCNRQGVACLIRRHAVHEICGGRAPGSHTCVHYRMASYICSLCGTVSAMILSRTVHTDCRF